ncbi:MAG: molybdopterin molybdotransferase MoeA [Thermoguttaceae bacterium]|jgi:molybdopterin molybdotransferase
MIPSEHAIPLDDALGIVDKALSDTTISSRKVAVRDGFAQILAADQLSRLHLPPFDKASMDGYAVLDGDVRDAYKVLETVMAGSTPTASLRAGAAVKVMTGAPVPSGAGRVIPLEHVRSHGDEIEVIRPTNDANICPQGEDVRPGDVILRAGRRLGPLEIANLISCGITEVDVFRPIRLAVLSTGDEIVDDPSDLGPGKIINANGPMLALLGRRYSMEIAVEKSIPDRRADTVEAISTALTCADLVLLSGGVSVGDFDFVGAAMAEAGLCLHFSSVAVKPGRPLTFATRGGAAVFGLPGNPVSAYVMFHLFVLRAAARMCGIPGTPREITLRLGREFRRRKSDRVEYVPCRIGDDGALIPVEYHGSAHLTALGEADGLFIVPLDISSIPAGRPVRFLPVLKEWQ